MKIEYELFNGKVIEIEVDDALAEAIESMEKKAENRNRAEIRRHSSYDVMLAKGAQFACDEEDTSELAIKNIDIEKLRKGVSRLRPDQREMLRALFYHGLTLDECADLMGVSRSAISQRLSAIKRKFMKIL